MDRKWMTADPLEYELLKENAKKNRQNATEAEFVFWSMVKASALGQRCIRQHIIPNRSLVRSMYNFNNCLQSFAFYKASFACF